MNVSANNHPLIIGIGNPLRSDDGLGWAVAEQLSQDCDMDCDIQAVYQLTPELAQSMAAVNLVVMIDASHEGEPGELCIRPLSLPLSTQPSAVGTHYTTPEELAALTAAAYGRCPPVVVVSVTGADFSIGEQLSAIVARRIPFVSASVRQICAKVLSLGKDDSRINRTRARAHLGGEAALFSQF
jgi:hydrogenase maturation protease